jgi:acyl-CoA synthetase (AMP-forming)/AMP-acid ligase II
MLHECALKHSGTAAIEFGDTSISYAALAAEAENAAAALGQAGLKPGDRIIWVGKNHPACVEMLFAASIAGAVLVPVNWRLAPSEMATIIGDTRPAICFADHAFADTVRTAVGPSIEVIVVGKDYDHWKVRGSSSPRSLPQSDPDAVIVQLYTSGTTGRPKGAMLSHRALVEPKLGWADQEWYHWRPDDAGVIAVPLFHIGGIVWLLMAMLAGARSVLLTEFDELEVFRAIEERKATKTFLVPSALRALVRHPAAPSVDFSPLRMVLYGASPMPLPLLHECAGTLQCDFAQVYGMTETSGVIAALDPDIHRARDEALLRATGRPLPGVEIAIRDPAGRTLPTGEVGELVIRTAGNMTGYWDMPEATRQTIDDDGWLRTGDAGYFDERGYLFVCDRVKDMIISGGENIYPAEVESVLSGHPAFAEVAVVGVPDERWGEVPMAFVVPRDGERPDVAEIVTWARSQLAGYKIPRRLAYLDAMPRNATGKIVRGELKDRARADS